MDSIKELIGMNISYCAKSGDPLGVKRNNMLLSYITSQQAEVERLKGEREELKVNKLMLLREAVDSTLEIKQLKGEGWISVDDRLPDAITKCLVYYRRNLNESWNIGFSLFNTSKKFTVNGDGIVHPTHWQPLPTEPKEDK